MVGLARAGYPLETCRQVLLDLKGNEYLAAERLFQQLLGIEDDLPQSTDEDDNVWDEEHTPLKEIYGSRFAITGPAACQVQLMLPKSSILPKSLVLQFSKPLRYPHFLPPHVVITSDPKLPSHVRLSLIRQAGLYAYEALRGAGMLWGLTDWMEENIQRVAKNPGRLSDLNGVVSLEAIHRPKKTTAKDKNALIRRGPIDWTPRSAAVDVPVLPMRSKLPAWKHRDEVISICRENRVVVVTGETGSGKSTQVPQFILDDLLSHGLAHAVDIICTQPRRISAIGLADRVSDERNEEVGMTVGYSIRGESKGGSNTKLRYVTTGVLLRRFLGDAELSGVTHVIVDEVHERTVDGDFLLLLLKNLLRKRSDLKIILMSATLEAEEYSRYFSDFSVGRVHIEGRTFPVRDLHLESILTSISYRPPLRKVRQNREISGYEDYANGLRDAINILDEGVLDYDLVASTVELVHRNRNDGGVLIFLPGIGSPQNDLISQVLRKFLAASKRSQILTFPANSMFCHFMPHSHLPNSDVYF
jgi:ATP-dependent RNA helicase DHX57